MRINHEDCDMPMPTAEDLLKELDIISPQAKSKFIPADTETLTHMWIRHVKISVALGSILRIHYRANGPEPGVEDIQKCAEELQLCAEGYMDEDKMTDALRVHAYQLQLFYEWAGHIYSYRRINADKT